ncbi:MMPL family transporter [Thiolapillus sp.]
MSKLMLYAAHRPWMVMIFVLLATVLAIIQLPKLKLEISAEGMMVENDPARIFYQQILSTFGSENITIAYLEDPDLFQPDKLAAIRNAIDRINASPLVQRTDSLFSRRYLRTIDGYTYTDPYLDKIPTSPQEAKNIKEAALRNTLVADNLLSKDGDAMAVNIYLDNENPSADFDQTVTAMLDAALLPLHSQLKTVFHVGDPYVRTGISRRIQEDQATIVPLALLMLVITLVVSLRHLVVAAIPLLTAGISILWTLGLMAATGIPVNITTSIIPALLIIIGSTEDIHLLTEYRSGIGKGKKPQKALEYMANHMGMAIGLTFITTYLGFLSITLNDLALLSQFGLISSTALAFNFLATVLLVPVALKFFKPQWKNSNKHSRPDVFTRAALKVLQYLEHHRLQVGIGLLVVTLIAAYGASTIRVNNNVMDYFSKDSAVSRYAQILHRRLAGMQTFSIIVSGKPGTFLEVQKLEELESLQEFLEDTGSFDSSYSLADFMGIVNSGIDSETPTGPYLPERDEVLREYTRMLDHKVLSPFVSRDFSQARIIVRHNINSSHELNLAAAKINSFATQWLPSNLEVQITGESYLNNRAADYMADGQARSLGLMLLVIFVLVSLLFMQIRAGVIAVLTNLFPIILLFGFMGYAGLPLDTGTAMVGAIAIGIAVDHSMHFMVRYQRAGRVSHNALETAVRKEATPIFATAIALAMGFATLSLSDFPPVARFGQLSALVMILALASTFIITPLLLWRSRLMSVWDILSVNIRQKVIDDCALFRGMRNWHAKKIIALSRLQRFRQDEAVFLQGQGARFMHVLLEGKAEVWRTQVDGSTQLVRTLLPGDVFGIRALMPSRQRSADVVAIEPAHTLALSWQDIHQISRIYPRVSSRLFENLTMILGDMFSREENLRPRIFDELSGAYNATYFVDLLKFGTDKANRYGEQLSLMSLELTYNESAGQVMSWQDKAGAIQKTAAAIRAVLRKGDVASRWKEQIFWVILPNTDTAKAHMLAQRIIQHLHQSDDMIKHRATVRMYITELEQDEDAADLIHRASTSTPNPRSEATHPGQVEPAGQKDARQQE